MVTRRLLAVGRNHYLMTRALGRDAKFAWVEPRTRVRADSGEFVFVSPEMWSLRAAQTAAGDDGPSRNLRNAERGVLQKKPHPASLSKCVEPTELYTRARFRRLKVIRFAPDGKRTSLCVRRFPRKTPSETVLGSISLREIFPPITRRSYRRRAIIPNA